MNDIYIHNYLRKKSIHHYGAPHKKNKNKKYIFTINIPCYNEFEYLFDTLDSIDKQDKKILKKTLVTIVINNANNDSDLIKKNNYNTYKLLITKKYNFDFIAIDCFSKKYALNEKIAGVGYARKIGLDYSLNHIVDHKSILCLLDADTIIDKNYLSTIKTNFNQNMDVVVINFKHQKSNNPIIEEGIRKYENTIKKIAKKIDNTGSPYGYVSMGSTIVCNAKSYIACGGMNTKKATEDFYFLQALAKYAKIHKIEEMLVFPSSRNENRVYLGTGFRMDEYVKNKKFKNLEFSNESYIQISKLIKIIDKNWNKDSECIFDLIKKKLNQKCINFLVDNNIKEILNKFKKNAKDKKQFILFFHQWFDALSIMKLLKSINQM